MQEKVEGKSQKSEKRSNSSTEAEPGVEDVAPLSTSIHNRQFDQPNRLKPSVILRMQHTYGNAYVSRMLANQAARTVTRPVQRAVNQPALEKLGTAASNVPNIPNDFPGAFKVLNDLPLSDLIDTLVAFRNQGDFDFLLAHFKDASGINVSHMMGGFLYATLRGLNPATPPTDLTLNRMALALRTTPAALSQTVMGYSENIRTKIINVVPSLGRGTVTGKIPEIVGGKKYDVMSAYDWQLTDSEIQIIVRFKFTGVSNPALVSAWFSRIKSDWNVFKAVDKSTTPPKAMNIQFEPQSVGGGEHHAVEIMPGEDRDNESHWYVGATPGNEESLRMAAHEFGHTVGLRDEYQLSHGAYRDTVKANPDAGVTIGVETTDVIAKAMRDALHPPAPATPPAAGAPPAPTPKDNALAVIQHYSLDQGNFAQRVADMYKTTYGIELVADIVATIPSADQFWVVNPFTFSNPSMMGSQKMDHAHSVQARHVADFARIIQSSRGGTWEPEPR